MDDATLDDVISEILMSSEHGRAWLKQDAERRAFESRLLRLHQRGVSRKILADLWRSGAVALAAEVEVLSPDEIAVLNRAARTAA